MVLAVSLRSLLVVVIRLAHLEFRMTLLKTVAAELRLVQIARLWLGIWEALGA